MIGAVGIQTLQPALMHSGSCMSDERLAAVVFLVAAITTRTSQTVGQMREWRNQIGVGPVGGNGGSIEFGFSNERHVSAFDVNNLRSILPTQIIGNGTFNFHNIDVKYEVLAKFEVSLFRPARF